MHQWPPGPHRIRSPCLPFVFASSRSPSRLVRSPRSHCQRRIASDGIASDEIVSDSPEIQTEQAIAFFEARIRPVLIDHCYQCHSQDAEEIGGSLRLDSAAAMLIGGDSGPAIVRHDADASHLMAAIRYESSEMPPSGKLPDHVIADFKTWINQGAIDPRVGAVSKATEKVEIDLDAGRKFWAFQPVAEVVVPVDNASQGGNAIDAFLNRRLNERSVSFNPIADPDTRLRRLSFDLTGLPPTLELQRRWRSDPTASHWLRIVDELLASPGYAEHWARHWMDVARYADSNGSDFNATFHDAWRYRDYLVRSFASDRPFDEMIRQQIAGDLMTARDDVDRQDNVVATTFLMLGTKMLSERDKPKLELDVVDEQIDTVGRALMGLTLGCARCHDHKFDPVPMRDYYALAGIFQSTVTLRGESQKYVSTWNRVELPTTDTHRQLVATHQRNETAAKADLKAAEKRWKKASDDADAKASVETSKAILKQLQAIAPEPLPVAMAVTDRSSDLIGDSPIYIRGEADRPGEIVPRGFLRVCGDGSMRIQSTAGSGRMQLAEWLTDPDHPLVARVLVNRVWMHLMGQGIVRTVDNFGQRGERPSHPELLDHLAGRFVRGGWQLKPMIREVVTSAAYQRSSDFAAEAYAIDPENKCWWRMPRRRLPAESIRDAMVTATGTLDREPSYEPMKQHAVLVSANNGGGATSPIDGIDVPKRSLYLPIVRGHLSPVMMALDMADPDLLTGQRRTTNVPGQSLALINSPEINGWARQTVDRVLAEADGLDDRLKLVYQLCYARLPTLIDHEIADDFFGVQVDDVDAWNSYVASLFAATEFRLLD